MLTHAMRSLASMQKLHGDSDFPHHDCRVAASQHNHHDANRRTQSFGHWGGLPADRLPDAHLAGVTRLPSSFAVGTAAQTSIAAAAGGGRAGQLRGQRRQRVSVDGARGARMHCVVCAGRQDAERVGRVLRALSNRGRLCSGARQFAHHRDGALRLLGLTPGVATRADAEAALQRWRAIDFEDAAAERGMVVAACRSFAEWDAHPQAAALATLPLITWTRIGDAPPLAASPALAEMDRPLDGVRVLDLTRILAGPVCGRMLAIYGADVLLVNSPNLPNIESIADTSRGKRSAHVDLRTDAGRQDLRWLLAGSNVFVQGYRPGGSRRLASVRTRWPGCVPASSVRVTLGVRGVGLGPSGAALIRWCRRQPVSITPRPRRPERSTPKALPMQILDFATGHLMAFASAVALFRQATEGGSWHVTLSLAQTAAWLRSLGRVSNGFAVTRPDIAPSPRQWIRVSADLAP